MKKKVQFDKIIKSEDINDQVVVVLETLFQAENINTENSISNNLYFDRYFSLSILPDDITHDEFDETFQGRTDICKRKLELLNLKNSADLAIKLHHKFKTYESTDVKEFEKIIEILLHLYQSVSKSTNQYDLVRGVNTNNLRTLIISIYLKAIFKEKDKIFHKIITKKRDSYVHISIFAGLDIIYILSKDKEQNKKDFFSYRELQLDLLAQTIEKNKLEESLQIISQGHRFVRLLSSDESNYVQEDVNWFYDNFLKKHFKYIKSNLKNILAYIKKHTVIDTVDKENAKAMINSIFHSIDGLEIFNDPPNDDAQSILYFYDMYETLEENFEFIYHTPPTSQPSRNDHYYKENNTDENIFDLKTEDLIIIITPDKETKFWRFGVSFSKDNNFPPLDERREITDYNNNNYIHIHLCIGNPDIEGDRNSWDHPEHIELTPYPNDLFKDNTFERYTNYDGGPVIFTMSTNKAFTEFTVKHNGKIIGTGSKKLDLKEFKKYKIAAWSDWLDNFRLNAKIKIRKRI